MHDLFICHSEKDHTSVLSISSALEEIGYSTWFFERDNVPGQSYLIQVGRAIEGSRCIVLLVSKHSLSSNQVTAEVVRAFEARIPFIPLLLGVTHDNIQKRQEVWRQALVTSTSLTIPKEGVHAILPRVQRGLETLGIRPADGASGRSLPRPQRGRRQWANRWVGVAAALFLAAAAVGLALLWPGFGRVDRRAREAETRNAGETHRSPLGSNTADRESLAIGSDRAPGANPDGRSAESAPSLQVPVRAAMSEDTGGRASTRERATAKPEHRGLLVWIDEPSGVIEQELVNHFASEGLEVVRSTDEEVADLRRISGRTASSDASALRQVAQLLGADLFLIGRATTEPVENPYGLKVIRSQLSVRLVDGSSGETIYEKSYAEKGAHVSREIAEQEAARAVATTAAQDLQIRIPRK